MKYKDIAAKYDVSFNTVKSWRGRYSWTRKGAKKGCTKKQKMVHPKKLSEKAIEELNDSELTDKQKAFVLEYLRLYNATQAYINVYDANYQTAVTAGSRMLRNVQIKKEINHIRKAKLKELAIEPLDLIEDIVKEAKGDIGNYLDFGNWPDKLIDKESGAPLTDADGKEITIHHSYLYFKDKDKVDTSLIKKITKGKDGATIELYDKTKARDKLLEWLKNQSDDSDTTVNINFNIPKEDNNASES
ncbi:terminase [Lactobacillus bombicola]|uniref:Terminase n=2 Tax=Lactobacillus bombicola TaxID=1505723 RepID=A0A396SNG5_9LACO|nr:terminase [Lactobacillus bombicola]